MKLARPTVLVRYSHSFGREIAQIIADGRHTSAVVWSSPDGRTVVTHTGSTYTLVGVVLLQVGLGNRPTVLALDGAPIRWGDVVTHVDVDGVEPLEVGDAVQS